MGGEAQKTVGAREREDQRTTGEEQNEELPKPLPPFWSHTDRDRYGHGSGETGETAKIVKDLFCFLYLKYTAKCCDRNVFKRAKRIIVRPAGLAVVRVSGKNT